MPIMKSELNVLESCNAEFVVYAETSLQLDAWSFDHRRNISFTELIYLIVKGTCQLLKQFNSYPAKHQHKIDKKLNE